MNLFNLNLKSKQRMKEETEKKVCGNLIWKWEKNFFIDFVDTFVHIQITQCVTLLWEINRHKFVADVFCESAQYLQVDLLDFKSLIAHLEVEEKKFISTTWKILLKKAEHDKKKLAKEKSSHKIRNFHPIRRPEQ